MKATKKNIHNVCKAFVNSKDLTSYVRDMKKMGVDKMYDMYSILNDEYTRKADACLDMMREGIHKLYCRKVTDHWKRSSEYVHPTSKLYQFARELRKDIDKNNGEFDNYCKVLIVGNTHIYWASPFYQHRDYNKSIAMVNTPSNVDKARTINRYILSALACQDIYTTKSHIIL